MSKRLTIPVITAKSYLNPRFGLYELSTIYEGYPVYTRAASKQNLFFQADFLGWKYAHRIIRWIIGPTVGKSSVSEPHRSRTSIAL